MSSSVVSAPVPVPVPVSVPERSLASDLRAVKVVWHREVLRFIADRPRIISALLQPLLYLFVLGSGLGTMVGSANGVSLRTFMFPGVMVMAVLFTCFFSAGSLVWDREFGFMREMLVAPISRWAIVLGKCLGGATAGVFQGAVLLAIAGAVGVPYDPVLMGALLLQLVLIAFALTSLGVLIASRLKNMQSFMAVVQMVLMPMFFMSGALFPLRGLPQWLEVVTRLDPLTYAVDPLRKTLLAHLVRGTLADEVGLTWGTWPVPTSLELGIVAAFAVLALVTAAWQFSRSE